jgi:hypothetical protein
MNPWIPAVANFFFPGLGNIISGYKRDLGIAWLIGVLGLTWVEQGSGLKEAVPMGFQVMFVSVFIMNIAFAVDAYRGAKEMGGK